MNYDDFLQHIEENHPDHWLADISIVEEPKLAELLETGSVTLTIGGEEYILSLNVSPAEA